MAAESPVSFQTTIAADNTAQQITTTSQVITGLIVKSVKANAATVRIGPATVGATSYPLEPNEGLAFDVIDPTRIYVYGKKGDIVAVFGLLP